MIFLLNFSIPLSTFLSIYYYESAPWFSFVFAFIFIPIMDLIYPSQDKSFIQEESFYFDFLLYLQLPIQYFLLFYFCMTFSLNKLNLFQSISLILSMGISCGVIGINVAHELGHRKMKIEKMMAKLLLCTSLYYQFFIDHNKGHHKHVATLEDPATARRGESIYYFWMRSILGTLKSAFVIDKKDMFFGLLMQLLLSVGVIFLFGIKGLLGFFLSALVGALLLESVNYIEHYGLLRKRKSNRYERVMPHHSWNSNHILSRVILFNLSRHSDHHHMVGRKYQQLRSIESSPQMPTGYPGMILLAMIPFLWFRVIHQKISTDKELQNLEQ